MNGARQSGKGFPPRKKTASGLPDATKAADATAADGVFSKSLRLVRTVQTGVRNIHRSNGLSGSQLWPHGRFRRNRASESRNWPRRCTSTLPSPANCSTSSRPWFRAQGTRDLDNRGQGQR